jgi:hypothetical protein
LPSVASETYLEIVSQAPKIVSSDFGQLAVNRHLMVGIDWAMAGLAMTATAALAPTAVRN